MIFVMVVTLHVDTDELETVGNNFKRGTTTEKSVTCTLNSPESWTGNRVVLTVKKTKPESTETITCTSEASQLDFSSSDDCGKTEGYKWWVTATQGKIEVAITHTLAETVVFRCDVTIDEDASDSKLVTSEALDFSIKLDSDPSFHNGERYMLYDSANIPDPELQIYGDSAKPYITETDFPKTVITFALEDKDGTTIVADVLNEARWATVESELSEKKLYVRLTKVYLANAAGGVELQLYDSVIGDTTVDRELFSFTLYKPCLAGQYTDSDGACTPCTEGVRTLDNMNQLYGCKACDKCPNEDRTECRNLEPGEVSRGGWSCEKCPGGTFPQENKCQPCPIGTARGIEDGDVCTKCNKEDNMYTPSEGFSECLKCNGFVNDNRCDACAAGQGLVNDQCVPCAEGEFSNSGGCEKCPPGSYSEGQENSECTKCAIGKYQDGEGTNGCKSCPASEGKYTNAIGSIDCITVDIGYGVVSDTGEGEGIEQKECESGTIGNKDLTGWGCQTCSASEGHYQPIPRKGECEFVQTGYYVKIPEPEDAGATETVPCEIGKYRDEGSDSFTKCDQCNSTEGFFQDLEAQSSCKEVADGYYIVIDKTSGLATSSQPCSVGTARGGEFFDPEAKFTKCKKCDWEKGQWQGSPAQANCREVSEGSIVVSSEADSTELCPIGSARSSTFHNEGEKQFTECKKCNWQEGQWGEAEGQSKCKDVPEGSIVENSDATSTKLCPIGTARSDSFYNEGETKFTACKECDWKKGQYGDTEGRTECRNVAEGSVVENETAISTKLCPVGTARSDSFYNEGETKFTVCKDCDWKKGQYGDTEGRTECRNVEDGFVVENDAAISTKPCPIGSARSSTFYNEGEKQYTECKKCNWQEGQWGEAEGQSKCKDVPEGFVVENDAAKSIMACSPGTARSESFFNEEKNLKYTKCKQCDSTKGEYQENEGQSSCSKVKEGLFVEDITATSVGTCERGTARGEGFRFDGDDRYTKCKPCGSGYYQNATGMGTCKAVPPGYVASTERTGITPCEKGTREVDGECKLCIPTAGEYQDKEGRNYCERIKPGYAAGESYEVPVKCKPGNISSMSYECVPCNAEMGEYQDFEGGSFCKAVNPGFELDLNEDGTPAVNKTPVKCKVGYFSKGSAKKCTQCDRDKKEYQNEEGATYCKICSRGKVLLGAAVCEGLGCKEETLFNLALREEAFVFSETAAGETLIIPCDAKSTNKTADKIYRYCIFDEEKSLARWDTPNYGACPTAKTEKLNQLKVQTDILKSKEKLASMNETELANSMKSLSSGMEDIIKDEEVNGTKTEVKLTSRDVKDVAGTLDSIKSVIELPNTQTGVDNSNMTEEEKKEMKEATTALKTTMAKTIDKVAASGEDTLKTVDDDQKTSILKSVEALANSMEGDDEPIVTSTLAVRTISMSASTADQSSENGGTSGEESNVDEDNSADEEEDEGILLPVPEGMEESEAPKLSLDMEASGASVAVFSEDAKDMFPDPTTAIDEDDLGEEVDEDGEPVKKNRTLNSAVVSLEFKNVKTVKFDLKMKTNTSLDKKYKGKKKFERTCTFLNVSTTQWSSKGCKTTLIGDPMDGNIKCSCNHNTSFAVLLSISDIVDKSQETATLVMFCINMTFLLLTFFAIAPFKKYRKKRLVVLQTQLVLSLIVANTGFMCLSKVKHTKVILDMFGYPALSLNLPCYVGVIIVQYLFLVVMAWMTCCAYTLYGKIVEAVKTYGKTDRFYVHKCVVFCWFLPALLPTSAFLTSEMMNNQDSGTGVEIPYIQTTPGKNKTDCWVANPWKWVSFMIPMYLCLLINCTVFGMIVRVLIRASKSGSSGTGLGKQIKGAVTIAVTVGVPWIVGVMTFEPIALVGQWLFIIMTGLQGPVMFVVFVILQEEVLGTLLRPFGAEVPEILRSARSGTSVRKTSAAFTSVLSREKPFDPSTIDPVAAKQIAEQKKLEEDARNNVYSNDGAINESEGSGSTRSNALLVKCDPEDPLPVDQVPTPLPTPEKPDGDQDHLYYECTHFPYDPDAVSLASHYPDPVTE